jgi:sulfur-carrier protein
MRLTVKYFASIREIVGIDQEVVNVPHKEVTLDELQRQLALRSEKMGEALAADRVVRTAVNMEMRPRTFILREDCEVAFFPPVTGG